MEWQSELNLLALNFIILPDSYAHFRELQRPLTRTYPKQRSAWKLASSNGLTAFWFGEPTSKYNKPWNPDALTLKHPRSASGSMRFTPINTPLTSNWSHSDCHLKGEKEGEEGSPV